MRLLVFLGWRLKVGRGVSDWRLSWLGQEGIGPAVAPSREVVLDTVARGEVSAMPVFFGDAMPAAEITWHGRGETQALGKKVKHAPAVDVVIVVSCSHCLHDLPTQVIPRGLIAHLSRSACQGASLPEAE